VAAIAHEISAVLRGGVAELKSSEGLVMGKCKQPDAMVAPPAGLSNRACKLWRSLVPRRARSPERLTLLETALRALDRADQAAQVLDQEGLTFSTQKTGAVHAHPLVKVEKEARSLFMSAWSALKLAWSELDGRCLPSEE
jgi:phage terminase small subunit